MKKVGFILMVVVLMLWSASAWAQFKDGLWEITTQAQMKGIPQQMPPSTSRQCMSKNDPVPKNQDKNYDCKTTSLKVSGSTVNYAAECKGPEGLMTVTGKSTYTGNAMDGSATISFKMKGQQALTMTNSMKGKYIGPCKQ